MYVPNARWCDFSYRTHDFEPFASSWPSKSPDFNPIKRNWDCIGRVFRRRGLAANVDNLHVQQFLMDGWNGITQRMLNVWGTCDIDAQSLPDRHRSEGRSVQLICVVMIKFGKFIHVLT